MTRGYLPGDAARLATLFRQSVTTFGPAAYDAGQVAAWAAYPDDEAAFDAQLRAGILRVVEVDGVPAAFGLLEEFDHIALLYCRPGHERRGLASHIMHELEDLARTAGQVVINSDASRISRTFFEHRGYHCAGNAQSQCGEASLEVFHLTKRLVAPTATRWLILGNSASGKSTLAHRIAATIDGAALDLDTIAWQPNTATPIRRDPTEAHTEITRFTQHHPAWVIEGCYEDLIAHAATPDSVLVLLDPDPETCLKRASNRGFERHKFPTPAEQAAALAHLKSWIADYPHRSGPMSRTAHFQVFDDHPGPKFHVRQVGLPT